MKLSKDIGKLRLFKELSFCKIQGTPGMELISFEYYNSYKSEPQIAKPKTKNQQ